MVEAAGAPPAAPATGADALPQGRAPMPRARGWLAAAAGALLGLLFLALGEAFFAARARTMWPAAAITLGLAAAATALIGGRSWWPRAAAAVLGSGVASAGAAFAALALLFASVGHCGLSPGTASWSDPSLYAAMPAPGSLPGPDAVWKDPAPGLPFAGVADASWGPHNLTGLSWAVGGLDTQGTAIRLDAGLVASMQVHGPHPPAEARARFLEWSGHVTSADEATRASWADAFVASNRTLADGVRHSQAGLAAEPTTHYRVQVPGPFRLEALHGSLAAAGALEPPRSDSPGLRTQGAGAWSFSYSLAERSLQDGDPVWSGPGSFLLRVDSGGLASFEGLMDGERSEDAYRADVVDLLDAHGLPRPDPAQVAVGGTIC